MRTALPVIVLFVSMSARADVGPPPPRCVVPSDCRACVTFFGEPDAGSDCRAGAADAGLLQQECTDRIGSGLTEYFCPPGTSATRGCGCAVVDPAAVVAAGLLLLRRRSRAA